MYCLNVIHTVTLIFTAISAGLVADGGLREKFTFNPKEGIDNPAMVITDDAGSVWTPIPRSCILKREDGEFYGFHLRVERGRQGHIIRHVVSGGVAERSGLRDGDRLLEVNNCYIDDVPHPEVARKIKVSGRQLCLLVLDGEDYERAVSRGQDLQRLAHMDESCKPPRLCHITRDPVSGLGITVTPLEGEKGRFVVNPVAGGAAEKAAVRQGDRLVWIDGAMVSDLTHSALSKMMKKCGDHITILVIDSESEKKYTQRRLPILPTMATPHQLPYRARTLHLTSVSESFGFLLRLEKVPSGRTYHVLRETTRGSPAERAGVRDGELLLEVNDESVESLKHEEVVDRVKLSGRELGLSPLLFCEDDAADEGKESSVLTSVEENSPPKETHVSSNLRLCSLQKGPLGFGFKLGCDPQSPGTFISQVLVASGGPGQSAGLLVGDVAMEVNGQSVEGKPLEDVTMLVEEAGGRR
ncbi:PDZ domain containing 3b isoform X5 [Simochromis diagramma]|uniref:PDZ domain containing 3b isoform X5 n=1 Tax=Simochromis diagramma TaxID=43689 RepID=UPI001A7EADAF|nr:PDZ domain containing 3b isoform X5 [Simochromis diagramma]